MLFACQKGFPFFSKQSCSELNCCLWWWMVLAKEKSNVKMFLELQSICKLLNLIRVKVKCYDLKIFWIVFLSTLFENRRNKMEENLKSQKNPQKTHNSQGVCIMADIASNIQKDRQKYINFYKSIEKIFKYQKDQITFVLFCFVLNIIYLTYGQTLLVKKFLLD